MKQNIEELRKKYMDNPPEGITSKDIRLIVIQHPWCSKSFLYQSN